MNEWILVDAYSLPPSKSNCFSIQKNSTHWWIACCCLLQCKGCCWIGLKPRFTL